MGILINSFCRRHYVCRQKDFYRRLAWCPAIQPLKAEWRRRQGRRTWKFRELLAFYTPGYLLCKSEGTVLQEQASHLGMLLLECSTISSIAPEPVTINF